MKRVLNYLLALLALCGGAYAQVDGLSPSKLDGYAETGMEVSGIRAPYYDDDETLRAQLYGGHAKVLEGGVTAVTNLRIDVYQDGQVFMTLFAPQCFMRIIEVDGRETLSVHSDGDVLIDLEQMTVSGRGFRFSSEQNQFEILHDSKVLVKESAREMKGLEL